MRLAILSILIASTALAAPDIDGAIESAERIKEQVKQAEARAKAMEGLYDNALSSRIAADKAHAMQIQTINEKHAGEVKTFKSRIAELQDSRAKLPAYGNMAVGGAITLMASFVMIFGEMRSGLRLLAVGLLISSIGYAMMLLGFWYAVSGLAFSVACVLGVIAWEIKTSRQNKVAAVEVIDANRQAMSVAAQVGDEVWKAIQNAAQSPHTKKLVDKTTK